MANLKKSVWPVLEKLSESREAAAFRQLAEGRQKLADCERREKRLAELRADYESRYLQAGTGRVQSIADMNMCRGFVDHVDGLQKMLGQQKSNLVYAVESAGQAYADAQREKMKWQHLEERDIAIERSKRVAQEQRATDAMAVARFAYRRMS
ncbi:MAG: flagellar FliJ family protein [Betaproteobacteria bacterium]